MKRHMHILVLVLVLAPGATVLTGCKVFSTSCEAPPTGEEVATISSLRVPEGVPAPDTANALRVPDLNTPEPLRPGGAPCLEEPPPYTPGWRPEENTEGEGAPVEVQKKRRWWWPWG
jgi:hypothetical protein